MSAAPGGAGVYVVRTRRPGLIGWMNLPVISRHFAYVGQSMHLRARRGQHLKGSAKYGAVAQPWADLKPKFYFIPLPPNRGLLLTVETILTVLLWPVYPHSKNQWNPRRIPLAAAKRQAMVRALTGGVWSFNFRIAHAIAWAALLIWQRQLVVDIWTSVS